MDYKKFFWATKGKTLLTLGFFLTLNLFLFMPAYAALADCPKIVGATCESPNITILKIEITFLGFSYLAACIVFHMKNKGGK
ncbi:MAG: hypothetical protein HY392_02500 [Candidatus Diapherotrites archaeon]|nr:hypothetical protein [Candidatus Diapherotrites archaeon]